MVAMDVPLQAVMNLSVEEWTTGAMMHQTRCTMPALRHSGSDARAADA
jgi:hypothetical protein